MKKLKVEDLKDDPNLNLDFKSSKDLEPFIGIIDQKQAVQAIQSAMEIKFKGFNLYVSGEMGIGKTNYILSIINSIAKEEQIPNDVCYIYNFDNPSEPIFLSLPAGIRI